MRTIHLLASMVFATVSLGAQTVVIVSAKNPISKLTREQTAQIFLGQARTFITGGAAEALDLPESSDLRKDFYLQAINKSPAQMKAYWSKLEFSGTGRAPRSLPSPAEVVKLVGENPRYVGYVDAASVNPSVKVVLTF